jgi:hypothetical protein
MRLSGQKFGRAFHIGKRILKPDPDTGPAIQMNPDPDPDPDPRF